MKKNVLIVFFIEIICLMTCFSYESKSQVLYQGNGVKISIESPTSGNPAPWIFFKNQSLKTMYYEFSINNQTVCASIIFSGNSEMVRPYYMIANKVVTFKYWYWYPPLSPGSKEYVYIGSFTTFINPIMSASEE